MECWDTKNDSVKETEKLENETGNGEPTSGQQKRLQPQKNRLLEPVAHQNTVVTFGQKLGVTFFRSNFIIRSKSFSQSLPLSLMPNPINGSGDFENYLCHLNTTSYTSDWYRASSPDF